MWPGKYREVGHLRQGSEVELTESAEGLEVCSVKEEGFVLTSDEGTSEMGISGEGAGLVCPGQR